MITALENVADYEAFEATIELDYQPRSATERELVWRLASVTLEIAPRDQYRDRPASKPRPN